VDVVAYYPGNGETFVSDDESRRDKAVPDKSSTWDNNPLDFLVNTLCNNEVGSEEDRDEII